MFGGDPPSDMVDGFGLMYVVSEILREGGEGDGSTVKGLVCDEAVGFARSACLTWWRFETCWTGQMLCVMGRIRGSSRLDSKYMRVEETYGGKS